MKRGAVDRDEKMLRKGTHLAFAASLEKVRAALGEAVASGGNARHVYALTLLYQEFYVLSQRAEELSR